jgi:hypothetical protein
MNEDTKRGQPETIPSGTYPHAKERPPAHPEDREHEGATDDEMTPTPPPSSPEYDDEPKQG